MRKKVVLYPRVSSLKQLDNDSLPTQIREMERFAEREGYEVARIFEDRGQSAKTIDRPALQEMLRWLRDHPGEIHAVLVYAFDRAARNLEGHLALRAALAREGVRLLSVTQPVSDDPHGKLIENIHAVMAQHDNDVRGQRSKLGMQSATERGRWCHQAPVGYLNCGRNAVPSLKPDPERAEVVRETFARVASGETPQSVYLDLVERRFTTRRGRIIGRQTFYSILRNPAYKGQLVTRLGFGVGDWDALVDEDTWEQVQAVVSQPGRRRVSGEMPQRSGQRPYRRVREGFELRGWLRCAVCGGKLTGGMTKGHSYINCVQGHVRARADVLSERFQVWLDSVRPNDIFLQRLDRAIRTELEGQKKALGRRRAEQRSDVRRIQEKLDRLNQALADGTMERDAYRETYPKLKAELRALGHDGVEDRLEELDLDAMLKFARHLLSQPGRLWAEASTETKIELQRALFPHGLVVDRALEFSTHPTDRDSMSYLLFSTHQEDLASLSIPSWNRLRGWLQDMDLLWKAA